MTCQQSMDFPSLPQSLHLSRTSLSQHSVVDSAIPKLLDIKNTQSTTRKHVTVRYTAKINLTVLLIVLLFTSFYFDMLKDSSAKYLFPFFPRIYTPQSEMLTCAGRPCIPVVVLLGISFIDARSSYERLLCGERYVLDFRILYDNDFNGMKSLQQVYQGGMFIYDSCTITRAKRYFTINIVPFSKILAMDNKLKISNDEICLQILFCQEVP